MSPSQFLTICLLIFGIAPSAFAQWTLEAVKGVLVLDNGEALEGVITDEGDRYAVLMGEGRRVRIPKNRVAMHCRSLREAYLRKRGQCPRRADAHLDLGEWCLRRSMNPEAAEEILTAIGLDAKNPRIKILQKRLQRAVAPQPKPAPTYQVASVPQMEETLAKLPPEAVRDFTQRVQPMLFNRCGNYACHGAGTSSSFRLSQVRRGQIMPQRMTQRNLLAALKHVDRRFPRSSKLLTMAEEAHAKMRDPAFSEEERRQVQQLAEWIKLAASERQTPTRPTLGQLPENLLQTGPALPQQSPSPSPVARRFPRVEEEPTPAMQPAATADPFDPRVFNQRFFPNTANR